MNDQQFDALTRSLAATRSRRIALKTLLAGGLAGFLASAGLSPREAAAAKIPDTRGAKLIPNLEICAGPGTTQGCLTNLLTDINTFSQAPLVNSLRVYAATAQNLLTNGSPAAKNDAICSAMQQFVVAVGTARRIGQLANANAARFVDDANAVRGSLTPFRPCNPLPYPAGTTGCATNSDCPTCRICQGGVCVQAANGSACDDGSACTVNDVCVSGVCTPGGAVTCDDGNPCTTDACLPGSGCLYTPVANGTSCPGGVCQNGSCQPSGCTQDSQCPTCQICQAGVCQNANGIPCDDGNACTVSDSCSDGMCLGIPVTNGTSCPGGVCQNGICQSSSCTSNADCPTCRVCQAGVCQNANGIPCDDGNACTVSDSCSDGVCVGIPVANGTSCPGGVCQNGICQSSG